MVKFIRRTEWSNVEHARADSGRPHASFPRKISNEIIVESSQKSVKGSKEDRRGKTRDFSNKKYPLYSVILFWALLKKLYVFLKKTVFCWLLWLSVTRVRQVGSETLKARHKVCTCAGVWPNAVCQSYPLLDFIEEENHLVGKNTNILNHLLGSSSGGIAFNSPYQFACIDPWK